MPPRIDDQIYDVKIDPLTNLIDHTIGGLSLFLTPNMSKSGTWWCVPKGTQLPEGFCITKDETDGNDEGHFSVRAKGPVHIEVWKNNQLKIGLSNMLFYILENNKAKKVRRSNMF